MGIQGQGLGSVQDDGRSPRIVAWLESGEHLFKHLRIQGFLVKWDTIVGCRFASVLYVSSHIMFLLMRTIVQHLILIGVFTLIDKNNSWAS